MISIPEVCIELRLSRLRNALAPSGQPVSLWLLAKMSVETHGALTVVDDLDGGLLKLLREIGVESTLDDDISGASDVKDSDSRDLALLAAVELVWGGAGSVLEPSNLVWIEVTELGYLAWEGVVRSMHVTIQSTRIPSLEPLQKG